MSKNSDAKTLAIVTHLLGLVVSFIGALVILFASDSLFVKRNARAALNWQISYILYLILSIPLMLILIGFATFFAVIVLNIVFSILAAVKASEGKIWKYPLAISFFKD